MTVLETFMSFAKGLPADRLQSVEDALATLMVTYSDEHQFTTAELDILDQRLAEPRATYADPEEINKLLGKPS